MLLRAPRRSENKLVIRGPGYNVVYRTEYATVAKLCGMHLSYKAWKSCQKEGLLHAAEALPDCVDPTRLKCGRCAQHSKFPECSTCASRRKAWLNATQNCKTAPELVDKALDALTAHMDEWRADRHLALKIRQSCYLADADCCYECDDKCGSFWQKLPVDFTGRHAKDTVNHVFGFSVQANVLCVRPAEGLEPPQPSDLESAAHSTIAPLS